MRGVFRFSLTYFVVPSVINVRQRPSTSFPVAAQITADDTITIYYGGALSTGVVPNAGAYKFLVYRQSKN